MDDAARMSLGDCVGYLDGNGERFRKINRLRFNPAIERLALNILHDDEVSSSLFINFVYSADVWMVERGRRLGLSDQAPVGIYIIRRFGW